MILYHGSSIAVTTPDILHSRDAVDFGRGFYTTPIRSQAVSWAERFLRIGGHAVVSRYEYDESRAAGLLRLRFDTYSGEWLDYIMGCRLGRIADDYDLVEGGVADDKVFNTCELYFRGRISRDDAIGRLAFEKPNWQICFKTQTAIDRCLSFDGGEEL